MSTWKHRMTLTRAECKEAIQMRQSGVRLPGITQHLHVSKNTLYRYMEHHQLTDEWKKAAKETARTPKSGNKEEITFFYLYHQRVNWKRTHKQIAKDLGCSPGKVLRALRRHGFIGMEEME